MSSSRIVGNTSRRMAIKYLESEGFKVAIIERTGRFVKEKDAFGVGDLLILKDGQLVLVQVTTSHPYPHCVYEEWVKENNVFLWQIVRYKYKGLKIFKYKEGEVVDLRKKQSK